jgi:amino acid transporter
MAGNAMNFSLQIMTAARPDQDPNNSVVRGIAIGVSVFACLIHTVSRRGGLLLNNIFAIVKVGILLLIIIIAIVYSTNTLGPKPSLRGTPWETNNTAIFGTNHPTDFSKDDVRHKNLDVSTSFEKSSGQSTSASAYSSAMLDVIFAFSGFEQANYVLGEISQPHRKFPISLGFTVAMISVLYMAVNVCYWSVVPQEFLVPKPGVKQQTNIAEVFFTLTLGTLRPNDPYLGKRISSSLIAISALGNVIVMTYTATRMKQEIAKEGILPWPRFFAQNYDLSIGRLLKAAQNKRSIKKHFGFLFRSKWLAPSNFQEKTPVGAMILHLVTCFVLILGTWAQTAYETYQFTTGVAAYLINAFFGFMLALGILYLRFNKRMAWKDKSTLIHPAVSITAAFMYLLLNLFPVIGRWFPADLSDFKLDDYLNSTVSWGVLGLGTFWWVGFVVIQRRKDRKEHKFLTIDKVPEYEEEPVGSGLWIQTHETVYIYRGGTEFQENDFGPEVSASSDGRRAETPHFPHTNDFDN